MGRVWVFLLLALSVLTSGCVSADWRYQPTVATDYTGEQIAIAVKVLEDGRPPYVDDGTEALKFLPGVPMYWHTITHPELLDSEGTRDDGDQLGAGMELCNLLSSTLAREVEASGVASRVELVPATRQEIAADLVVTGRLLSLEENRTYYYYGVSVAAPVLWMLMLPPQSVSYRMAYDVTVQDADGVVLLQRTYRTAQEPDFKTLYGEAGGSYYAEHLPKLAQRVNRRVVGDIRQLLETTPRESWVGQRVLRETLAEFH